MFPYIYGEACDIRSTWEVYAHLFMSVPERTEMLGKYLGGLIGVFQQQIQDDIFVSIGRLTDKDRRDQKNLSLWRFAESCSEWDPQFGAELKSKVAELELSVKDIRLHRHKRLAHFDLSVSLKEAMLPVVTFQQLRGAIDRIEAIVNMVTRKVCQTTIMFDVLSHREITAVAEATVAKAAVYDALVEKGVVERRMWRDFIK